MKRYTSIALIGVLVVGMAGFISLDAISATSFATMKVASDVHETGKLIGHVTYELRGADGNIKQYLQSDNVIVDRGTDCAATAIFDTADTSGICTLGTDTGFSFIAIGNSTTPTPSSEDDTALDDDGVDGREMARLAAQSVGITSADTLGTGADTTVSIVSPAFEFLDLNSDPTEGTIVTQSGLFDSLDSTGSNNMFSARDIPGLPGIRVTNVDTLSVTWTITLQ